METLIELSNKRLRNTSMVFKRYLTPEIDWSDRLISIVGARGSGKTTLILQHLKETYGTSSKALYISLDNIYFTKNLLVDTADKFVKMGGETLYLDEVHKYPNWSIELKNLYDDYPELKIIFSGSSLLEIFKGHGDLSRRVSTYKLANLSFREFLAFDSKITFPTISLNDIIKNHIEIADEINKEIKPLVHFEKYLNHGVYPFFKENLNKYHERLLNIINVLLDADLPSITVIDYAHIVKIKLLLKLISEAVPYKPNITKLATQTEINRKSVLKYLNLLERAELIKVLHSGSKSDSILTKPSKIYLGNPNLMHAICEEKPNAGTIRETFFLNQLMVKHTVWESKESDFIIDKTMTFEVGGKNKGNSQITGIPNSFVAADNLEYGFANHIPLWMFGFMY